jgi:hypothetical protein
MWHKAVTRRAMNRKEGLCKRDDSTERFALIRHAFQHTIKRKIVIRSFSNALDRNLS